MPTPPSDPIMLSALEHFSYCPRQCALIHVEQTFDGNLYTVKGDLLHERVHEAGGETEKGVRVERGVPLWSDRLGLIGKADVVEYHGETPYPVEYKLGPRRDSSHAAVQLCAQALCLEEMTGRKVPKGAIYHHGSRRRREVEIDAALRAETMRCLLGVRDLLEHGLVPPPANDERCRHCSLRDSCLPRVTGEPERVSALYHSVFEAQGEACDNS